jgi:hypothetical protein
MVAEERERCARIVDREASTDAVQIASEIRKGDTP